MLPRDDEAEARRNLALVEGGLLSHQGAMDALGELDPEAELQRVVDDRQTLNADLGVPNAE